VASPHAWDMSGVRGMEALSMLWRTASLCIADSLLGAHRAGTVSGHGNE